MQRRKFIQLTSTASALTLLPSDVFGLFQAAGMKQCPNNGLKKIVLIQLAGANDGLNTLVPIEHYDTYVNLRPNIHLKNSGANKIINLDSTVAPNKQLGLHPVLTGFKDLYDSGMMHIIQGVGYPNSNKSHFKSSDLWLSGGDGTPANFAFDSGWMGRFIENYYTQFLGGDFPLGIQLGSGDNSLGFHGKNEHGLSININNQDFGGYYSIVNGLGGTPPSTISNSEYGDRIRFLMEIDAAANRYGETISTAFNSGSNTEVYPDSDIANQLKTVAKFISGGLETKVYLVRIGGFDTHDGQVISSSESHKGYHAKLLKDLSDAVHAFITDLNNQSKGEDVLTMTFSEFGRKAAENANLGTDHGEVAPLFCFGKAITPGISGTNSDLNEAVLENNYQIQTIQHDYRSVFSTVLQDWLGCATDTLDKSLFNFTTQSGFSELKLTQLINAQHKVPKGCYLSQVPTTVENEIYTISVAPNPSSDSITIKAVYDDTIVSVHVFSIDGKQIGTFNNPIISDTYYLSVESMAVGLYTLVITTKNGTFTKKIIVRR